MHLTNYNKTHQIHTFTHTHPHTPTHTLQSSCNKHECYRCIAVSACVVAQSAEMSACMWLWGACRWCSSQASAENLNLLCRKDEGSHHAKHMNSKISPPVGCWFWVVPRSMLLEALTCWNCRGFWFGVGDWGWAGLLVWEFSLKQIEQMVTADIVIGRAMTEVYTKLSFQRIHFEWHLSWQHGITDETTWFKKKQFVWIWLWIFFSLTLLQQ